MQLFGENIGDKIGQEVKTLIDNAYKEAINILSKNTDKLQILAEMLLEKETVTEEEFEAIF